MNPTALIPGVPASGHLTSGGHWHAGPADGCVKGTCSKPARVPWCSEHRRALSICQKYGSSHIRPSR